MDINIKRTKNIYVHFFKNMLKREEIEKIERYIKGESKDNEITWVESLFVNSGEDNQILRQLLRKDWDNILKDKTSDEYELKNLLDRIHHLIRKDECKKKNKTLQKFVRFYMKVAAVLLVPLLIAGGVLLGIRKDQPKAITGQKVTSTIYAPMGSRVSFVLPDSTTGMLNSGSHLTYEFPFNGTRKVKLEGEAWFEVNRDEENPFEVSIGSSTVKALGTRFNVSAYPAEDYVEVVLQDGKVEFQDISDNLKVTILPSERIVYQNGNITKSVVDPAKFNAWTEGKLIFRGDPMVEVARRIERWYNVKVNIADRELENYSFRATFQDDKFEDVLRFLALTSPIRFKITPRILLPDGTYKKMEATISKIRF
jgi:ferric-dicitrate binding protein FerR (iron transport regulator)